MGSIFEEVGGRAENGGFYFGGSFGFLWGFLGFLTLIDFFEGLRF